MVSDKKYERIPTGITGFDDIIGGGLRKNSTILIRGGTGVGKTIFSLQYIYEGASKYNQSGMFISFSESEEAIYETGEQFGWNIEALEKKGKFSFVRYSPYEIEKILAEGGGTIKDTLDSIKAERIVIDSLTAYSLLFKTPYEMTDGVVQLFDMLKSWNCTTMVTDEQDISFGDVQTGRLGFFTDALIHFYSFRKDLGRYRALEVIKMRHTNHSEKIHPFKIDTNGISIYSELGMFTKPDDKK